MIYYVNNKAQTNGDYVVHTEKCIFRPSDKKYLGEFSNCVGAVEEAKKTYYKSNGCRSCSNSCHTS